MRLRICIRTSQTPFQSSKQLVYIPQSLHTILQVEEHLKDILDIEGDLVLRSGQYILPKRQTVKVLDEQSVVDCYVNNNSNQLKNIKGKKKTNKKKISLSSSSSQVEIKIQKSFKKPKLNSPQQQKNQSSSSSQDESSHQSSSESIQQIPIKRQQNRKISIQLPTKPKPTFKITQQLPQNKRKINEDKLNKMNSPRINVLKIPIKGIVDDIETEEYPAKIISYKLNNNKLGEFKQSVEQKHQSFKLVDLAKQKQFQPKNLNHNTKNNNNIKNNNNNNKQQNNKPTEPKRQIAKSTVVLDTPKPVPVSNTLNYRQIPMKTVQKYTELNTKGFLEVGDEIEYKVTEFDEEKFLPVLSDWILAKVQEVDGKGSVMLLLSSNKSIKLSEINMFGLRIKPQNLKEQRKMFLDKPVSVVKTLNKQPQPLTPQTPPALPSLPKPQPSKPLQLINQLNYYFSDLNYRTDNYLIMHASKNKQSYIPLKCFMNFNKLKPLVANQTEMEKIIRASDLEKCEFQIHPEKRMIRKREGEKKTQ